MTNEEILSGNKLIAEFMRYDRIDGYILLFHISWDWLMPVIAEITNQCEEPDELDGVKYALLTDNISEAYIFVVDYINRIHEH